MGTVIAQSRAVSGRVKSVACLGEWGKGRGRPSPAGRSRPGGGRDMAVSSVGIPTGTGRATMTRKAVQALVWCLLRPFGFQPMGSFWRVAESKSQSEPEEKAQEGVEGEGDSWRSVGS